MQIVEVKNNLVKISYRVSAENLILSAFLVIKDSAQSFIAQVVHLEANEEGNFAIAKLLFTFGSNGVISNYNGSIPELNSVMEVVPTRELLDLLPAQNPILLGELAQQNTELRLDRSLLEKNLLICSEMQDDNKVLVKNIVSQANGAKFLVFDLDGGFDIASKKVVAGKNFKLPLNYESINFIYERGLDDAKAETKALIQDIFLEVQEYVKTLADGFIPLESFKNVVDGQYQELELVELVLLKNKLLKYNEAGVFAQNKNEFESLELSLKTTDLTVFDLSLMDEKIQREMISYAYSTIAKTGEEIYVILNVNNANSDKKLLKQIFTTKNAYSSLLCSYNYKYLNELKQLSKNLVLFAPIQQQNDFAGYNVFLSKLNPHEFVVYGDATHSLPLIVKLEEQLEEIENPEFKEDSSQLTVHSSLNDDLDEQINRDVDEIYMSPKEEIEHEKSLSSQFTAHSSPDEDELTEDDLDFIENGVFGEEETFEAQDELVIDEQEPQIEAEPLYEPMAEEFAQQEVLEVQEEPASFENESFASLLEEGAIGTGVEDEASESILPVTESSVPIVPIYSAEIEPVAQSDEIVQGDSVVHPKYGKGVVEKLISYGSKTLCSINFDNVGRRLLDPTLAEIKKAD